MLNWRNGLRGLLYLVPMLLLAGCEFEDARTRVGLLVLVPFLLILLVIWLLNRRDDEEENWEDEHFPDQDDDDNEDHFLM